MSLPAMLALIAATILAAVIAWLLIRSRNGWPTLPEWTWNDIRKNVALVATIVGAAILTVMAWGLLDQLVFMAKGLIGDLLRHTGPQPPPREVGVVLETIVDSITWGLKLLLTGVIVVLLSMGLVITPRKFDFHLPGGAGGSFGGGDGELPAEAVGARKVAEAAEKRAEQIEEKAAMAPTPKPDDPNIPDYAKP